MTDELKAPGVASHRAAADPPDGAPKPKAVRIVGLDGLRGIGCIAVILGHVSHFYTPRTNDQGMIGLLGIALIIFFVLSGFLLFLPYARRILADPSKLRMPGIPEYALHRVLRVFPAYLVIFLFCNFVLRAVYVVDPVTVPNQPDAGVGMITDPGQLFANLTLTQTYFPQYFQTGINPAWSLTLEIGFYLSLPLLGLLVFALRKRFSTNPLTLACLAPAILIVVGVVGRIAAYWLVSATGITDFELQNWGPNGLAVYLRSFASNADLFGYGMLAAILFVAVERGVVSDRIGRRVRLFAVIGIVPLVLLSLGLAASQNLFATSAIGGTSAALILIIIAPLARREESLLARVLDWRPFFLLGMVSLSAYLWHYPVLLLLGRYGLAAGDSWPGMIRNVVIVTTATLVLATITYYSVELPCQKMAQRYGRQ